MQGQQMFLVVYREYLEDLVRNRMVQCGVKAFSELPRLWGRGSAGLAEDSWAWPGHNCALFTVLPEEQVQRLVAGFRDLAWRRNRPGARSRSRCAPSSFRVRW